MVGEEVKGKGIILGLTGNPVMWIFVILNLTGIADIYLLSFPTWSGIHAFSLNIISDHYINLSNADYAFL